MKPLEKWFKQTQYLHTQNHRPVFRDLRKGFRCSVSALVLILSHWRASADSPPTRPELRFTFLFPSAVCPNPILCLSI